MLKPIVAGIAVAILFADMARAQPVANESLSFDEFGDVETYRGKTHFPQFDGRDKAYRNFRTRIREGMKGGPNFAGSYTVIEIGCGASCRVFYIADNKTGRVFDFPFGGEFYSGLQLSFKITSRLIVAQWANYSSDSCMRKLFQWTGSAAMDESDYQISPLGPYCFAEIRAQ